MNIEIEIKKAYEFYKKEDLESMLSIITDIYQKISPQQEIIDPMWDKMAEDLYKILVFTNFNNDEITTAETLLDELKDKKSIELKLKTFEKEIYPTNTSFYSTFNLMGIQEKNLSSIIEILSIILSIYLLENKFSITLKERIYNGKINIGSVIAYQYQINKIKDDEYENKGTVKFYTDCNNNTADLSLGMKVYCNKQESKENKTKLEKLIRDILLNKDYTCAKKHTLNDGFDKEYFKYVDIIINNIELELEKNDKNLELLKELSDYNIITNLLKQEYKNVLSLKKEEKE